MPAFNAATTIGDAINSVLNQSFHDFELVIVDDGSTDNTVEIVSGFTDPRIRLFKNTQNIGAAKTADIGMNHCRGTYVCRLDADDMFHKNKIKIQYNFMEQNPKVILSGTHYRKIRDNKLLKGSSRHYFHVKDEELRVEMLRNCPLNGVMFRRQSFLANGLRYRADYYEDYDLWLQASRHGRLHKINRPLLYYRVHSGQTTIVHADKQLAGGNKIRESLIRELVPDITEQELKTHLALMSDLNSKTGISGTDVKQWVDKVCRINEQKKAYNTRFFNRMMRHRGKRFFQVRARRGHSLTVN